MNSGVSDLFKSRPIALSLPPSGWYPSMSKQLIAYLFLVINNPALPTTSLPAFITEPALLGTLNWSFRNWGNVSLTCCDMWS